MVEVLGGLFFAAIGFVLLLNLGGAADLLARFGRHHRTRSGVWLSGAPPQATGAVRLLLGLPFFVLGVGVTLFPPS